jgi:hypothetical protein
MAETTTPTEVKMKKILLILMATMLWVCPVWADEIDEALQENTRLQIRSNIRLMVDAGISKDDATKLTRSMLQHRFTEGHIIEVQNMLMETIQADLPVGPVMDKAFEGMAKNKPGETIVQAMKKTKSRWTYADRKAQELTTDEETQDRIRMSIAQGMGAGLQDDNIEPVMAQLQTRTRLMSQNKADELCLQTFLTTRTMARLGVDPDNVSDVVSQALQNQFTAREMQQLRSNFNNQSHEMSPNQLANQFSQKLGQGEKPGDSGSSNENNAGQSGSNQGSGSEPGNTSEGMGGSKSGSDTGGSGGSGGSGGGSGKQ